MNAYRKLTVLVLTAAVALPGSAATATSSPTLAAYIATLHPLIANVQKAERGVILGSDCGVRGPVRASSITLLGVAARIAKVAPFPALRPAQPDLVAGIRAEGTALSKYLAAHAAGADACNSAIALAGRLLAGRKLERSWREETVAQCRRAGIAVPLWLKAFAA